MGRRHSLALVWWILVGSFRSRTREILLNFEILCNGKTELLGISFSWLLFSGCPIQNNAKCHALESFSFACFRTSPISSFNTKTMSFPWMWVVRTGKAVNTLSFNLVEFNLPGSSPSSISAAENNSVSSQSLNIASSSQSSVSWIWAISLANANSSRSGAGKTFLVEGNCNVLGQLYRATRRFAWYFASIATMSPADNLAIRFPSFKCTAHSLTYRSTSRVEADRKLEELSALSQKKHWLFITTSVALCTRVLDLLALIGLPVPVLLCACVSASFLFFACSNLVLLNKSLHYLCQDALRFARICSMPGQFSSSPLKYQDSGIP